MILTRVVSTRAHVNASKHQALRRRGQSTIDRPSMAYVYLSRVLRGILHEVTTGQGVSKDLEQ